MRKENEGCILIYKKRKIAGNLEREEETTSKKTPKLQLKTFCIATYECSFFR